jgi:hypothetical protein
MKRLRFLVVGIEDEKSVQFPIRRNQNVPLLLNTRCRVVFQFHCSIAVVMVLGYE